MPMTTQQDDLRGRLERAATLRHLLNTYHEADDPLRDAPAWEAWLERSGELPPDFNALPASALLPDLLTAADGTQVRTSADWERRRQEVRAILDYYQLGSIPPPPRKMLAEELGAFADEATGATLKRVCLLYGPVAEGVAAETGVRWHDFSTYRAAELHVELLVPPGPGPFPAVVGIGYRRNGRLEDRLAPYAARRGYVVCLLDIVDAFAARNAFPGYDENELVWWAYAASRCVDYLRDLAEVDPGHIAVAGHSRGGKMAVIAMALDERFSAGIASHPGGGSGTVASWRYLGEKYGGETVEFSTRVYPYWNHPRLRFFAGRENRLPFDSHFLLALAAPRPLLIGEGQADDVDECWGGQQAYLATKEVYRLLGRPEALGIVFHPGGHDLSRAALEGYVDWLDMCCGRRPFAPPQELMYTYTFDGWRALTGEQIDPAAFPVHGLDDLLTTKDGRPITTAGAWAGKREEIRGRVLSILGEPPPAPGLPAAALANARVGSDGLARAELELGAGLVAHLTYCPGSERLPVAIYLHAYTDSQGWNWRDYGWSPSVGERLALSGFLAVEYDQLGYGRRNRDCGLDFYRSYPRASALAAMVQDVERVIEAVVRLELADGGRVAVAGYSLGGAVALHAAALDERIRAVASTCGFASLRLDAHGAETEGLRRYSHLRPTLPRLGFFVGWEARVPYDYHELLALVAPRPALILAPRLDQDWYFEDVRACYDAARGVYRLFGAEGSLCLEAPDDFNRYPPRFQDKVNTWLMAASSRSIY
jgi:dienelactone hydrolase